MTYEFWNPKIEKMPREELYELQERRLRALVYNLYHYSPFYRKRFKEHGITPDDIKKREDIAKLPFTRKSDLRDTYPLGMLSVPKSMVIRFHASSGTSGKPTVVAYTENDVKNWTESLARALTSIGLGKDDIIQVSYGYGLFTGGLGLHYGAEKIGASVLPAGTGSTERQIELMMDLGSTAIACTPSYMLHIAEVAEKMGISIRDETQLRIGILGAEPWSERMRRRIEDSTGIDAYDIYGTSELSGPLFTECTEKNGLHIWADHFLVEVVDEEGEPVGEGERGELVVTTLTKEAIPLIRYRTGDVTILEEEKCPCGRTHPRIMRILGRTDDMLIVRGINVFPSQIEHVLMQIPEVGEHFQIIVDRKGALDEMTVMVEVKKEYFSDRISDLMEIERKIEEALKNALNLRVNVELVEHGTIPRTSGKAKKVIDRREI